MSTSNIQVPTWALPLIVSVFVGAVSYGAATAEGQATAKEVERVGKIAVTVQAEAQKNGKQIALNQQAIQQIADGLWHKSRTDYLLATKRSLSLYGSKFDDAW